jgi:hypothetical protein
MVPLPIEKMEWIKKKKNVLSYNIGFFPPSGVKKSGIFGPSRPNGFSGVPPPENTGRFHRPGRFAAGEDSSL